MNILPSSSRTAFLTTTRRFFATQSAPADSGTTSIDKGKKRETGDSPLYAGSNAASRPRPNHRSFLYGKNPQLARSKGESSNFIKEGPEGSRDVGFSISAASHAARNTPQALTDETLDRLYRNLARIPINPMERMSHVLLLCREIKRRLAHHHSPDGITPKPPFFVFLIQLHRYAAAGEIEMCRAVLDDMEHFGFPRGVEALNFLLKAGVMKGSDDCIEETLLEISSLSGQLEGEDLVESSTTKNSTRPILSTEWTKNWTIVTFQHLISHCRNTHNAEYMLALLASASHRKQEGGDEATFLSMVLSAPTVVDVLETVTHCREARLAFELAQWMDTRVGSRNLNANNWINVLRNCAQEHYMPGVEVTWDEAVVKRLLSPDDGLVVLILVTAARAKKTKFIEKVLEYHESRLAKINASLQEWHLMPLFQSQCADYDFEGAFKTGTRIARSSPSPPTTAALIDLRHRASESPQRLNEAYNAMMKVGRSTSSDGGISLSAFKNLLSAANALGDTRMALKIYRSRTLIRNERASFDAQLPPDTEFSKGSESKDVIVEETLESILGEPLADLDATKLSHTIVADVDVYNILLACAERERSEELGALIYRHLNGAKVKANERTYEMGIRLTLLKEDYQPAFRLLEECKKRNLIPTRWTYLHLAIQCRKEDDPRWIDLALEMLEAGHGCGSNFYQALAKGGHLEQVSRSIKDRFNVVYHRQLWDPNYVAPRSYSHQNSVEPWA